MTAVQQFYAPDQWLWRVLVAFFVVYCLATHTKQLLTNSWADSLLDSIILTDWKVMGTRLGRVANFVIHSRESFSNLIGATRFHAAEVNDLNAPTFPASFLPADERAWERGYSTVYFTYIYVHPFRSRYRCPQNQLSYPIKCWEEWAVSHQWNQWQSGAIWGQL